MKTGAAGINAHLLTTVLTLAELYKIEFKDGSVLGLSNHDAEIIYDGVTYYPSVSVSRSAIRSTSEFSVDNLEFTGILDSTYLTDDDLLSGKYDGAEVCVFIINYKSLAGGIVKLRRGQIGNVTYEKGIYKAEIRGMLQKLNKNVIRAYSPECDAEFGNSATGCKFDLSSVTQAGAVVSSSSRKDFLSSGLTIVTGEEFRDGRVEFTSGLNDGITMEVKNCDALGNIELFLNIPFTISASDTFDIIPGCLKSPTACKAYDQMVNYRGFPFIKGQKDLYKYEIGAGQ